MFTLVVFAGGSGGRMLPLSANVNKVLLPYKGKPILQRCLEPFIEEGFKHIIFLTSHLAPEVETFAKKFGLSGIAIDIIRGDINLNSRIKQILPIPSKGIITVHGNIILNRRTIQKFVKAIEGGGKDFVLLSSPKQENFFSGHPFTFTGTTTRQCRMGLPQTYHAKLKCCIGLNYMSGNALTLLQDIDNYTVPEDILCNKLLKFSEVGTASIVKHFEVPKDLLP